MDKSDRDISQWDARLKEQLERSFHNYHKRRIDLSVARDNKQFDWTGETLIVEKASSADANATVRFMFEDADELTLQENIEIKSIFNRIYISNDAQTDEWLDVIAGINFEYKKKISGHKYVSRGDPDEADFDETDFTVQNQWTDIDLSSIVPSGTVLVLLAVLVRSSTAGGQLQFRKNGNTNFIEGDGIICDIANQPTCGTLLIPCDADRKIEYFSSEVTWTWIDVTIKGWFI